MRLVRQNIDIRKDSLKRNSIIIFIPVIFSDVVPAPKLPQAKTARFFSKGVLLIL